MEKSTAGTNKRSPDGLSHPKSKYNNNKHNLVIFIRNGKSTMNLNCQKTKWT